MVTATSNRSTRRGKTVSVYVSVYVCAHWGCSLVRADRKVGIHRCFVGRRKGRKGEGASVAVVGREPTGVCHGLDMVTRMALVASEVVATAAEKGGDKSVRARVCTLGL